MKKTGKRALASILAFVMIANMVLTYLPSLQLLAAPITETMSHLAAGTDNGNGHFGAASPEAFVLSNKNDIEGDAFSFKMKLGSESSDTRFRFVTKYTNDTNWAYIGYDTGSWYYQYKKDSSENWPSISGLSALAKDDVVQISGSYTEEGLVLTVENQTKGTRESAKLTDETFLAVSKAAGKIGYGAGNYSSALTDIYITDTTIGQTTLAHSDFTVYESSAAGCTWESVDGVVVGDDGQTDPGDTEEPDDSEEEDQEGRKWIVLQGGSQNTTGHIMGTQQAADLYIIKILTGK